MQKIFNYVNLGGWSLIFLRVTTLIILTRQQFVNQSLNLDIHLLKLFQILQALEIVLMILGFTKGSILSAFFHILGRNVVSLVFLSSQSGNWSFALVAIFWSLADIIRYVYYIFKQNRLAGVLRYNAFRILYPLGVCSELLLINDYMKINSSTLTQTQIYLIRFVQLTQLVGVSILYAHLLKQRQKFMKKIHELSPKDGQIGSQTQKVPNKQKSDKKID